MNPVRKDEVRIQKNSEDNREGSVPIVRKKKEKKQDVPRRVEI